MKFLIAAFMCVSFGVVVLGCNNRCKRSCKGLPDGQYQSCKDCKSFIFCYGGKMGNFPCGCGTVWDDFFKRCENTSETCPPGKNPCLTNCIGIPDGVYQSCKDCNSTVICHDGKAVIRTCPKCQQWDDSLKDCVAKSSTCPPGPTPPPPPPPAGDRCVRNCAGVPDGDYQSCLGCHVYASCVGQTHLYDNRSCPANLVWDDFRKRCEYTSPTCPPGGQSPCMSNCTKQPNGTYQSCKGCNVFAKCENEKLTDGIACKKGLIWDDALKICSKTSRTCKTTTSESLKFLKQQEDNPCITSCVGLKNGNYQYCKSCHQFAMCSNQNIYIMNCPGDTLWDDRAKLCLVKSTTCPKYIY